MEEGPPPTGHTAALPVGTLCLLAFMYFESEDAIAAFFDTTPEEGFQPDVYECQRLGGIFHAANQSMRESRDLGRTISPLTNHPADLTDVTHAELQEAIAVEDTLAGKLGILACRLSA